MIFRFLNLELKITLNLYERNAIDLFGYSELNSRTRVSLFAPLVVTNSCNLYKLDGWNLILVHSEIFGNMCCANHLFKKLLPTPISVNVGCSGLQS